MNAEFLYELACPLTSKRSLQVSSPPTRCPTCPSPPLPRPSPLSPNLSKSPEGSAPGQAPCPFGTADLLALTVSFVPSIARGDYSLSDEHTLTNNFKKNAIPFVERRPTSEWEWLFLMRHHDVPTRLLDWSESAPVGLFFATHSLAAPDKNDEYDGALWVLLPTRLNRDAGISFPLSHDLPMFEDDDRHMTNYTPSQLALESTSHLRPAAALAVRQSRRMEMQHSVFTVSHRDLQPLEDVTSEDTLLQIHNPRQS